MNWYNVKDYLPESGETVLTCCKVFLNELFSEKENAVYAVCTYYQAGDVVFNEKSHASIPGSENMSYDELLDALCEVEIEDEVTLDKSGFYSYQGSENGIMKWVWLASAYECAEGISHWCYIDPPEDDE